MSDNEKINAILEYVCSSGDQSCFETDQIASAIKLPLAETNMLVRQLVNNGDAKSYSDNDISSKGAIGLMRIVETKDAYETNKYIDAMGKQEKRFNVFVTRPTETYNILDITESKVSKLAQAYMKGNPTFTIDGEKHWIKNFLVIKIFTYEKLIDFDQYVRACELEGEWYSDIMGTYFTADALRKLGKDVTDNFIGDFEFGEMREGVAISEIDTSIQFVNISRLQELRVLTSSDFDLSKLIRLCEELNDNYNRGNYLSTGMIGRTILNHIPPIFGYEKFEQVASNYGSRSFKKNMEHLNISFRSIADSFLHEAIRKKETLPNATQIDFRPDLDRLLEEIVRFLK